jgi:hypothetical protein
MKNFLVCSILFVICSQAHAGVIVSSGETIAPSSIDKVIRLVDKDDPNSSYKKLSIVVTDSGRSTDVSPRYTVYLGYASYAEMGNLTADFKISDQAIRFISASRKSAGIYEVVIEEYREEGMFLVTKTIDATQIFIAERARVRDCGEDFCDGVLTTSVIVTETATKIVYE